MQKPNRRTFLQTTAGTLAFGLNAIPAATQASTTAADKAPAFPPNQTAPVLASNEGKKPLRLGLVMAIGKDLGAAIAKVRDLGLPSCQVFGSDPKLDLNQGARTPCCLYPRSSILKLPNAMPGRAPRPKSAD